MEDVLNQDSWMSGDEVEMPYRGTPTYGKCNNPAEVAIDQTEPEGHGRGNRARSKNADIFMEICKSEDDVRRDDMGMRDSMEEEQKNGEGDGSVDIMMMDQVLEESKEGEQELQAGEGIGELAAPPMGRRDSIAGGEPMDIGIDSEENQGVQETQEEGELVATVVGVQEELDRMSIAAVVMGEVTEEEGGGITDSKTSDLQEEDLESNPTTGSKRKTLRVSNSCYRPRKRKRLGEGQAHHTPDDIPKTTEWARVCYLGQWYILESLMLYPSDLLHLCLSSIKHH